jgi:hypothetical protein
MVAIHWEKLKAILFLHWNSILDIISFPSLPCALFSLLFQLLIVGREEGGGGLVLSCFSISIFETTAFQIFYRSKLYLKEKNRSVCVLLRFPINTEILLQIV